MKFLSTAIFFVSMVSFPAHALNDTLKDAVKDTFIPPKILVQQYMGSNPNLTPLIENGNEIVFLMCFALKHSGEEALLMHELPLKKDAAYYAIQVQHAEEKLASQCRQGRQVNGKMILEGAAQTVGSLVALKLASKCLPDGYGLGLLVGPPLLCVALIGAAKMHNGVEYREYLQRRVKSNNMLKRILGRMS